MDKMNKVLYVVIIFLIGELGIHKFLNGRTKAGIVQIILSLLFVGLIITIVEFFYDIFARHADENGDLTIPTGFFDFSN